VTTASPSKPKKAPKVISKTPVDEEVVETGFGIIDGGNAASALTQVPGTVVGHVAQTAEDTGEVVEADDEITKKVNALLAKKTK
jgi:hypothetical protein